tara:strand:- start:1779 stop:2198 length:420 start_codon:yes stop_codon:yes gene_type:complete
MTGPNSTTVHLNFRPRLLDALTVLEGILEVCPVQCTIVMEKPVEANAEIHDSYKNLLGDVTWETMERWAFYDKIREPATTLIIQTGEQRRFANLILTVGVIKMAEEINFQQLEVHLQKVERLGFQSEKLAIHNISYSRP